VPLTSVLTAQTGGWELVFWIAAGMNAVAAVMALAVLKPVRARLLASYATRLAPSPA